jgi:hypothetical protein
MGKPLKISKKGVHIAFAAGTGVLVFLDLACHLLRKSLNMISSEDHAKIGKEFKFILYAAF